MKHFFLIILSLCSTIAVGQNAMDYRTWMAHVADTMPVARMLIPGAHDATTGEGFAESEAATYAVTQDVGLALQFDSGIRAFDLRPVMHGDTLWIAHGQFTTRITFAQAMDILIAKLAEHPNETVVVLIRNESDTEHGSSSWAALMERELGRISRHLAQITDDVRLGDVRGRIMLFSRDAYLGRRFGAMVGAWPDMPTYVETEATCDSGSIKLLLQDFYMTKDLRQATKIESITSLLRRSASINSLDGSTWVMNYASGYALTDASGYSLSEGYRLNAAATSSAICQYLTQILPTEKPSGIVFMDFAGVNLSEGITVGGLSLTQSLIRANHY